LPFVHDAQHFAFECLPDERRVVRFRADVIFPENPLRVGVKHGELRAGTGFDFRHGLTQYAARCERNFFYQIADRQFFVQKSAAQRKGCFQPNHPKLGIGKFQILGLFVPGCVVGADEINRAIGQPFEQGIGVGG